MHTIANCASGSLRLIGGESRLSGRVEICLNDAWGTVCDDLFDNNAAAVACAQLTGFSQQGRVLPEE